MSDDYKVQISTKLGANQGAMLNVRGNSVGEVDAALREAEELLLASYAGFESAAEAVGLITRVFPGTTGVAQQQTASFNNGPQPAQRPAQAGNGGAEACPHGAMVWKTGDGWAGWFCPTRREDPTKCKPRYQR